MTHLLDDHAAVLEPGSDNLLQAAQSALSAAFGKSFDFWAFDDAAQRWFPMALDGVDAAERTEMDTSESCPTESEGEEFALALRDACEPALFALDDRRKILSLPLGEVDGRTVTAIGQLESSSADAALQMARLLLDNFHLQREVVRCREDLDACAAQIGSDFEELAFLRHLADHLDITEVSQSTWQVAEMVLPLLARVIQAESLVLVAARQDDRDASQVHVGQPAAWVGPRCLDDESCRRFIESYREAAAARPLVNNHLDRTAPGRSFPGVRKFILVTLSKGSRVLGWLAALNHQRQRSRQVEDLLPGLSQFEFGTVEAGLLNSVASMLATHARNVELFHEKESLLISVVRAMVSAIDAKDPYTCGHSERVALVGRHLSAAMGLDALQCERVYLAGLLHDLGKLGVPDAVLQKPGRLTPEELEQIRPHPEQGWAILQDLDQLKYLVPGVLHHHERYDGAGYPDGLRGEEIPVVARILAVADSYDAMISDRPYRKGMCHEAVQRILREGAGSQWDPAVIDAFFANLPEIKALWHAYRPQVPRLRQRRVEASP